MQKWFLFQNWYKMQLIYQRFLSHFSAHFSRCTSRINRFSTLFSINQKWKYFQPTVLRILVNICISDESFLIMSWQQSFLGRLNLSLIRPKKPLCLKSCVGILMQTSSTPKGCSCFFLSCVVKYHSYKNISWKLWKIRLLWHLFTHQIWQRK